MRKKYKTPTPDGNCCVWCGSETQLEVHHVFFGSGLRNLSSEYKCVEWLCYRCHRSNLGVHGGNKEIDLMLKQKHQERLEEEGMTREEFMSYTMFGKNYL